ncbi:unnamed protein product [Closterium sp. NIES-64]|nr:unnamed protein product [Closterium sp. NIES-64]CAI5970205.1 unnamed protein product [Closterium sp. NIES-64]
MVGSGNQQQRRKGWSGNRSAIVAKAVLEQQGVPGAGQQGVQGMQAAGRVGSRAHAGSRRHRQQRRVRAVGDASSKHTRAAWQQGALAADACAGSRAHAGSRQRG